MTPTFKALLRREFFAYFRSPIAFVYTITYILAAVGCAFYIGRFFDGNQASLDALFSFFPWIGMVMVPAFGMRLWAEERRSGTIELILTLPTTLWEAVVAKFLAAWFFLGLMLLCTVPMVITVNYLGAPDNKIILTSYLGSFLLYGVFLAVTSWSSAMTKNQVISFVIGVLINFVLMLLGWGLFGQFLSSFLPMGFVDFLTGLGVLPGYEALSRGIIDSRDLVYFVSIATFALAATYVHLETKKAQ